MTDAFLCAFQESNDWFHANTLWDRHNNYPHFTDDRTSCSDVCNLSKVTQLIETRAIIQTCCLVITSVYIFIILTINCFGKMNDLTADAQMSLYQAFVKQPITESLPWIWRILVPVSHNIFWNVMITVCGNICRIILYTAWF